MTKQQPEQKDAALRELVQVLAGLRNEQEVDDLLMALLTPREREKIALRWKLVRMLESGLTQRAIAGQLGVSLCKITRGSRELKTGRTGFRRIVRRSMEQKGTDNV
ncbi:MAG: Trp family transcriptional regulator [bacterium]